MEEPNIVNDPITYQSGKNITNVENVEGDIHIVSEAQEVFSEINLKDYESRVPIYPVFADQVLAQLRELNLVILGGNISFDKISFSRLLASRISKNYDQLRVLEKVMDVDESIIFKIGEYDLNTLFILNNISPQDISYNIKSLIKKIILGGHFVIINSNLPKEIWKITEELEQYWFQVPDHNLYEQNVLKRYLMKLVEEDAKLKKYFALSSNENNSNESSRKSLEDLAGIFKSPEEIELFIFYLQRQEVINSSIIEDLILKVEKSDQDGGLSIWFNSLGIIEKKIVIALTLFEGLYDDQFFAALEILIRQKWKEKDKDLIGLDYSDLDFSFHFYKLDRITEYLKILRPKFPQQRISILKAAWNSHRRLIISSLPILIQLVKSSVSPEVDNWELFGSRQRKRKIRQVISETISDIGLISREAIETSLLTLASDDNLQVQEVAARAIARWREASKEEEMFSLLENWQNTSQAISQLINFIRSATGFTNTNQFSFTGSTYTRSTIAITIALSGLQDVPNQLPNKLYELLEKVVEDDNRLVRQSVKGYTIPLVVRYHFSQLEEKGFLKRYAQNNDLYKAIATGIALAYQEYPIEVERLLDSWAQECSEVSQEVSSGRNLKERDYLLLTIIEAYEKLPYNGENEVINIDKAYDVLKNFRANEHQAFIRQKLLDSSIKLAQRNFEKARENPVQLLENVGEGESDYIIENWTHSYVNQREELKGGDYWVLVEGFGKRKFDVWLDNSERPKVLIEDMIDEWVKTKDPTVIDFSLRAKHSFRKKFDDKEDEIINRILLENEENNKQSEIKALLPKAKTYSSRTKSNLFTRQCVKLAKLFASEDEKSLLEAAIPLVFQKEDFSKKDLDKILLNLQNRFNNDQNINIEKIRKIISRMIFIRSVFPKFITG